jgi:basic membrane lipoprotein Med (substrate-binding protein (PBP1-ABC) superfamily)
VTDPSSSGTADDGTGDDGTGGQDGGEDMTGASPQEVADLVDELEEKALAEVGDPQRTIADEARTGTDRAAGDAEPPV